MSSGRTVDFVHPSGPGKDAASKGGGVAGAIQGGGDGDAGSGADPPERLHRVRVMGREMGVGFSGGVLGGLAASAGAGGEQRAFYPLGNSVVVRHLAGSGSMTFLTGGHQHRISCLHLSEETGAYLATGEEHEIGTKVLTAGRPLAADAIVHDCLCFLLVLLPIYYRY